MAAARCRSLVLTLLLAFSLVAAAGEALTHLPLYFHEVVDGAPNATNADIVSLHRNGSTFGDVTVYDVPLREGPDPASRLLGRAQGFGVHTSLDGATASAYLVFVFSSGAGEEYAGSTLATQGVYNLSGGPKERSIVGGTGKLRFARGYMISRVLSTTNISYLVLFDLHFTTAY